MSFILRLYNFLEKSRGTDKNYGVPAIYDNSDLPQLKEKGGRLKNIDKDLAGFFKDVCILDSKVVSVWYNMSGDQYVNTFKLKLDDKYEKLKWMIIEYGPALGFGPNRIDWEIPKTANASKVSYVSLFSFNKFYSLMSCIVGCTLDTPLYQIEMKVNGTGLDLYGKDTVIYYFTKRFDFNLFIV